jgi:hypothetical protein
MLRDEPDRRRARDDSEEGAAKPADIVRCLRSVSRRQREAPTQYPPLKLMLPSEKSVTGSRGRTSCAGQPVKV